MEKSNYQAVRQYIFNKLNDLPSPLGKSTIVNEIQNLQKVIDAVPKELLESIISVVNFENLSMQDWSRLQRDFEIHFDVEMRHGFVVQGDEQQQRDTTWWSSIEKQKTNLFYWGRYKDYLSKSLPPEVVKTTDVDTDMVMNNLANPNTERFSRYGMVVGHVQSGKTLNYSSLVCKAADVGYKFIVVIAGGINNLRDQTQERLNEAFVGYNGGIQVGAGVGNASKHLLPLSLTTIERDFNKQDADRLAHGINFETVNVPVLLVIKKNTNTLKNVIEWLEKQYRRNDIEHAMLIVDDESDYASINTKDEDDPTIINKRLRQLLSLFKRSAYVAYTATPYANIFIDHKANLDDIGGDLFPKDFIYALDAPTNYFGARKIFIDSNEKHLVSISENDIPYTHKKEFRLTDLPEDLKDAIRLFLLNISIRRLRGQGDKHNSMLVHVTRFTDVHKNVAVLVEDYLINVLRKDILAYALLSDALSQSGVLVELKSTFHKHYTTDLEFEWDEILVELPDFIESVVIRDVHNKSVIPLEYRKDIVTNAIVVGGASLARGFTVEGLSVSYFLRNTVFYDTLMQMGRWFGYRPGYEDICKIFMPRNRIRDFAEIIRATEDLVEDFKLMSKNKKTPDDFGLYIQENPDSVLQITARNKQRNMTHFYCDMRLDGSLKETSYLRSEEDVIKKNIDVIRDVIQQLPSVSTLEKQTHVWKDVDRSIVRKFINEYKTFDKDKLGLSSRMPIGFIKKYIEERDTKWDIALYSGNGKGEFTCNGLHIARQTRQIEFKGGAYEVLNRQVSSGTSEAIAIEDPEVRKRVSNDRKAARGEREKPLLMLHILEVENKESGFKLEEISAFGISFNGNAVSEGKPVRLMINTVYFDQLEEGLKQEEE